MSTMSLPVSSGYERSMAETLSFRERLRLGTQLSSAMLAAGLLLTGVLLRSIGPVEHRGLAELVKAIAVLVVSLPLVGMALRGAWTGILTLQSGQLVLLAVLAAFAQGDFLTAALIPILMTVGHVLEERSVLGAQAAIDGLRQLQGRSGTVLTGDGERETSPDDLRPGDMLLIRPGDEIAADGIVRQGTSAVDQSSLTGESRPEDVAAGSTVFAGSVNLSGLLQVEVTRAGNATTIGRVVSLLHGAEQSKTPVMRLIEKYSAWYTPLILVIAAIVLALSREMSRAVAVLIVGCPMAIILAGPAAMVAALAAASRLGILVKNSKFLEVLSDTDTVVLDKTGTVTFGRLEVTDIHPVEGVSLEELLRAAAACASASRHPVCRAIVSQAVQRGLEFRPGEGIREEAGHGIRGDIDGTTILVGRRDWLSEEGVPVEDHPLAGDDAATGSLVWIGRLRTISGRDTADLLGVLSLSDQLRGEARHSLETLRTMGVERQVLLTGDRRAVAETVAGALGVDTCISEALPAKKLEVVQAERAEGRTVMVVGDGVNDALALASGDVGVAMGAAGSDIALRSADVVLMASDLRRLPQAIRLARRTRRTMHQNVLVGLAVSLSMLALAASGTISPVAGAMLHNVGEIYVLLNSGRLLRFEIDPS